LDCGVEESIASFFKDKTYDIIFHCAAYTQVDLAEDETAQCNTVNSESIAWIAKYHPTSVWFWYFSTDYVFPGIASKNGLTEEDQIAPINAYGLSKWHGEEQVRRHFSKHTIVRVAWLYSTRGKNFFKTMLQLGNTRTELKVVNDQKGSPTYVKDLSTDLVRALVAENSHSSLMGTFHYSPEGETTWFEFAQEIFNLSQQKITLHAVNSDAFPQKAKRPSYSYLNHSKWIKTTGDRPLHWQEQLKHCWEDWHKIQ
jgi:dTDP-4-dehydrorhamnose reductase